LPILLSSIAVSTLGVQSKAQQVFPPRKNANNGQKSLKLPIPKEACQKIDAHERQ